MVSKEGKFFRQQLCKIIADALCQWMIKLFGQGITATQHPGVMLVNGPINKESGLSPTSSLPAYDYSSIVRDRRLRVIFSKVLKSASSDKFLMLRFCWASLIIMITASTLACHRATLSLSEAYLGPIFDPPKRYAVSAWYFLTTFGFPYWKREHSYPTFLEEKKRERFIYMDSKKLLTSNCVCSLSWMFLFSFY